MKKNTFVFVLTAVAVAFLAGGCGGLHVNVGPESKKEPLKEFTLEGKESGKVLVIPIRGLLSDAPKKGFISDQPSIVEEVTSQLRMAEKDREVKAVVIEIDSPGGTVTASDILYHEIMTFKRRTGATVVAVLMDVAASGGYYIALPADRIVAHPGTITGSVGVIFIVPKVGGLMDKIGLAVEVHKSGKEKDIATPFRPSTPEEKKILQEVTDSMGKKFLNLVARHRKLDAPGLADVSTARIYLADQALQLKLIDRVGYVSDAISEAKDAAGLSKDAKVVAYRRTRYPNDNVYNPGSGYGGAPMSLVDLNLSEIIPALKSGFYYLWAPGASNN
jgi:protease IV